MKLKAEEPSQAMEDFFTKFMALMREYGEELSAMQILAVCAQTTGRLIAMQDKTAYTADGCLALVIENIQDGNAKMLLQLMETDSKVRPA